MRTKFEMVLAAACGICGAMLLTIPSTAFADTPLAETSPAVVYAIDTLASPRAVKTAGDLAEIANGAWKATRRSGETVSLTAPDGTITTLAAADSSATSVDLPLNAGGVWTVGNSKQGISIITVRRSLDGTLGTAPRLRRQNWWTATSCAITMRPKTIRSCSLTWKDWWMHLGCRWDVAWRRLAMGYGDSLPRRVAVCTNRLQ